MDLLVRTSGEVRLSDFLLWEVSICALSLFTIFSEIGSLPEHLLPECPQNNYPRQKTWNSDVGL